MGRGQQRTARRNPLERAWRAIGPALSPGHGTLERFLRGHLPSLSTWPLLEGQVDRARNLYREAARDPWVK